MNRKKFLFYLDILGFRTLVKNTNATAVYNIIDSCLKSHDWIELLNFETLCFSDTIISWSDKIDTNDLNHFGDLTSMASLILSELYSENIPVRGVITFGDFIVGDDSLKRNRIFFGEALIDAYDSEKSEKFIGVHIRPSVYKAFQVIYPQRSMAREKR